MISLNSLNYINGRTRIELTWNPNSVKYGRLKATVTVRVQNGASGQYDWAEEYSVEMKPTLANFGTEISRALYQYQGVIV